MLLVELGDQESIELDINTQGTDPFDWHAASGYSPIRISKLVAENLVVLLDGKLQSGQAKQRLRLGLDGIAPGFHELRLQSQAGDVLRQKREAALPLWSGPSDSIVCTAKLETQAGLSRSQQIQREAEKTNAMELGMSPEVATVSFADKMIEVEVAANEAAEVSIWHGEQELGRREGSQAEFLVNLESVGMGPVLLQGRGELADGRVIASIPLELYVAP